MPGDLGVVDQGFEATVPLSDLQEHPQNPRRGDVDAILESMEANGFYGAVVAQRSSGRVLAGNHRLKVARQMGAESLPVIWVDVDDDRALRILLADNRASDRGSTDATALGDLLRHLAETDLGLTGSGYSAAEIPSDRPRITGDPDEAPPPAPNPISTIGDVWVLGDHRVMCGDSTSPTDVERLMAGALADMVWTDPPYGVAYAGKTKAKLTIMNDGADEFEAVLAGALDSVLVAAQPGAPVYVAAPSGPQGIAFALQLQSRKLFRQRLAWVKSSFTLGHMDYQAAHEDIYLGYAHDNDDIYLGYVPGYEGRAGRGGAGWYGDNKQTSVLEFPKPTSSREHPTMKPTALISLCLKNSSAPGGIVLDLFGGSGSTLIACHDNRRHARLMELDPVYVDVICKRFQRATGVAPVNEASGVERDFLS